VKRLTTHTDKTISQLARRVVSSWKNHFEEKLSRPSLDVRCDHATTESRDTVRKHVHSALVNNSQRDASVGCHVIAVVPGVDFNLFASLDAVGLTTESITAFCLLSSTT